MPSSSPILIPKSKFQIQVQSPKIQSPEEIDWDWPYNPIKTFPDLHLFGNIDIEPFSDVKEWKDNLIYYFNFHTGTFGQFLQDLLSYTSNATFCILLVPFYVIQNLIYKRYYTNFVKLSILSKYRSPRCYSSSTAQVDVIVWLCWVMK